LPLFYAEKALPALLAAPLGRGLRAPFMRFARQTTGHVLDNLGASRELKAVLTAQWGDYGLPPGQSSFGIHAIRSANQGYRLPVLRLTLSLSCLNFLVPGPSPPGLCDPTEAAPLTDEALR